MPTININKWNTGIRNDPRDVSEGASVMCSNFDGLTDNFRLIPYRDSQNGNTNQSDNKIKNFQVALRSAPNYSLFGLGVVTGQSYAKIFYKDITTGGSNDLDDSDWAETSNNASASGATSFDLFVYYKKTGKIYGARNGSHIWAYDPTGSVAFADTHQALSYTNISQGLVHSKDDILYIPYDNVIATNNNGSWNTTALTLPSHLRIRSLCEYGNYLAIACEPLTGSTPGFGGSVVYLWDRDSTLNTLTESIYWGDERLLVLEEVNGTLIGISIVTGSTRFNSRVVFRYVSGSSAIKFNEFTSTTGMDLLPFKQKINTRLYFLLEMTVDGISRNGVWSVGGAPGAFSIFHERTTNNDSTFTDLELFAFQFIGDFLFISYADSAVNYMKKTNSSSSYTATSIFETTINPKMSLQDRVRPKKLMGIRLVYEPIASGGQVLLKYRVDSTTSWSSATTIRTDSTVGSRVMELTKAGNSPFRDGREYEFRIESKGVTVVDFSYAYKTKPTIV